MGVIFISHSSRNNDRATEVRDWLRDQGYSETFLDLDPEHGLATGQRWQEELRKAGERCSAIVVLLSTDWAASRWCQTEFLVAQQLGKRIFPVMIEATPFDELPVELKGQYQIADISRSDTEADGFERLSWGMRRAGLHPTAFQWPPEDEPQRSAYPGLRAMEENDAAIFFGRGAQITKGLDELRRMRAGTPARILGIAAASGAGKSSFLKAGLLARLARDTETFLVLNTMRPGQDALAGKAGLLNSMQLPAAPRSDEALCNHLTSLQSDVLQRLMDYAIAAGETYDRRPPTLVVPIDQGEELFAADNASGPAAISLLKRCLKAKRDLLVLITIRSDSIGALQDIPELAEHLELFSLPALAPSAFKEIIEGPGAISSPPITFEPDLTNRLIEDLDESDALPILAFTLERLVADHGDDQRLELSEYTEGLGGIGGAINGAVEAAFQNAIADPDLSSERDELDSLARQAFIPWLVQLDEADSSPRRRVASLSDIPKAARPLIGHFVDQHILVTDRRETEGEGADIETNGAETVVEVSHEAVLRHWLALGDWIDEDRLVLERLQSVQRAAKEYFGDETTPATYREEMLVHRGQRLKQAERLLDREDLAAALKGKPKTYLEKCRDAANARAAKDDRDRKRRNVLKRGIAALTVAILVGLASASVWVFHQTRALNQQTSQALLAAAESQLRARNYDSGLRLALLGSQASILSPLPDGASSVLAHAGYKSRDLVSVSHLGLDGSILFADETRLLTWGNNHANIWDATNGDPVISMDHEGSILRVALFDSESRLLTWGGNESVRIWDVVSGEIVAHLSHAEGIRGAELFAGESRLLTWSEDNSARIWDAVSGEEIIRVEHNGVVIRAELFAGETRLLTRSEDKSIRIWDAATGEQIAQMDHRYLVSGAQLFAGDTRLLSWSWEDGLARIWDVTSGDEISRMIEVHRLEGTLLSADGTRLVTWSRGSYDSLPRARIWEVASGEEFARMNHDGSIQGAKFFAGSSRLLTWVSGRVRIWNTASGEQLALMVHQAKILGVQLFADESLLLTWSEDNSARIWNTKSGEQVARMDHLDRISGAQLFAGETRLLTWSWDKSARIWDASNGEEITRMDHEGKVSSVEFIDGESRLLTWSSNDAVRIWDAVSGVEIVRLNHQGRVEGAQLVARDSKLLTWSQDNSARLWDVARGDEITRFNHSDSVRGAQLFANDNRLLSWSHDDSIRIWDVNGGEEIIRMEQDLSFVSGAKFFANESRLLTWSSRKLARIWDTANGNEIARFQHKGSVKGARLFANETRLLTWTDKGGEVIGENSASIWDLASGDEILRVELEGYVQGAQLFAGETKLLAWSWDGTARIWDAGSGDEIVRVEHGGYLQGAELFAGETKLLTWSSDETARIWDAASGNEIARMEHEGKVTDVQIFAGESRLLTWSSALQSSSYSAQIWDLSSGEEISHMEHEGFVHGAQLIADGTRLLTWSGDKSARIWDTESGDEIVRVDHAGVVRGAQLFADDTKLLTRSSDNSVRIWDVASGDEIARMNHQDSISDVQLFSGNTRLLTWSSDNSIRIWDVASGDEIVRVNHTDRIMGVRLFLDETRLLSWSWDNSVRIWDIAGVDSGRTAAELASHFCSTRLLGMTNPNTPRTEISAMDKTVAPILRTRAVSDVCAAHVSK